MSIHVKIFAVLSLGLVALLSGWPGIQADTIGMDVQGPHSVSTFSNADQTTDSPVKSEASAFTGMNESPLMESAVSSDENWSLEAIHAAPPGSTVSQRPVLVAVLDTGIDASHEELVGRIVTHKCFVEDCEVNDKLGHGTFIAGIIAADADNDIGTVGVAPDSILLNVKVADDKGMCRQSDLVEGIIWAVDNGALVINISIELSEYTSPLEEAIDYAWRNGALVIAAAGNEGNTTPVYPAAFKNCVAVTGIDKDMDIAPLANHGEWVDVAAPGFMIYGVVPGDAYGYQHGTSFATAYVSGLAARLFPLAADTNDDGKVNDEVLEAILAGCREVPAEGAGSGLIDVAASLQYLLSRSGQ